MKVQLPHSKRESYLRHRKQVHAQIILPVVISAVLLAGVVALITYSTFNAGGDVSRWAAISTIWIIIPILLGKLIILAALVALIYGMAQALKTLPRYTGMAQDYVHIARTYIIQGADKISGFIISVEGFAARIKTFFKRIVP